MPGLKHDQIPQLPRCVPAVLEKIIHQIFDWPVIEDPLLFYFPLGQMLIDQEFQIGLEPFADGDLKSALWPGQQRGRQELLKSFKQDVFSSGLFQF